MREPPRFSLANRKNLFATIAILVGAGSMCAKCGWGTRATSKRYATCKNPDCRHRVERVPIEIVADALLSPETEQRVRSTQGPCLTTDQPMPHAVEFNGGRTCWCGEIHQEESVA